MRDWLLHMKYCPSLSIKQLGQLCKEVGSEVKDWSADEIAIYLGMKDSQHERFKREFQTFNLEAALDELTRHNIDFITYNDQDYPRLLFQLYDPPVLLFLKGRRSLLSEEKLAIVGTRKMTNYGKQVLRRLIPPLCKVPYTIVSGLALGVDAEAHRETLSAGGNTIAVIGSGLLQFYPIENKRLFEQIVRNGLVISEYAPNVTARKWHFPERNRLISGLSLGTVIVQAEKRSGSLITADASLNQNREVFAVPGDILHACSEGTNKLIQEGAKLVMDASDIIEEIG
ncbi:DNA-processing protein DprA [Listeria booriae]|uniref:DNA-processing protein DprA n=1 Tax=Listeria booriae TaxID=1552123 RepID=UPI001624DC84|nr:DNA-processing protein DprA [Listeria booriae]MBC1983512.1 DNA-protecting protein DprA [Listeria booriae]